ncbi:invasion associated locus B family protein [Nitrincola iocasae]|uniref:Invasion associated locus B family protein n=1 Tax=Nitrincola iocasae TaxID=2614693 RepID=A0A5J6LE51_9GAMM|nr:invasion associated locus B family protein [Nitrincola iocasae]QEW06787.1 invasion associated locus B family protein [Nitrincola iocasae]
MIKMNILRSSLLLTLFLSSVTFAQTPQTTAYQDWVGICAEVQGQERCEIQQVLNMENEQGNTRLLRATVSKLDNQLIMQLLMPLGLDVRPGVVMQVDEGEEFSAPFLTCVQEGCLVAIPLDESRLTALRSGSVAKVGFRPFNTDQTLVLELSLMGFTRASQTVK